MENITLQHARMDDAFLQLIPSISTMAKAKRADVSQDEIEKIAFELYLKQRTVQMKKPVLSPLEQLIPVVTGNDWTSDSILHATGKGVGDAKVIANPTDDLPRIDIKEDMRAQRVHMVGDSYGFKLTGQFGGNSIELSNKATIAREAVERKLSKIALFGDDKHKLDGLFTTEYVLKADKALAKETLLSGINSIVRNYTKSAEYVFSANTIILPSVLFEILADTYKANNDTISLLDTFKASNPDLKIIADSASELGDEKAGQIVLGRFEQSLIRNNVVAGFRQFTPQARNLEAVVNCVARTAGLEVIDKRALQRVTYTLK